MTEHVNLRFVNKSNFLDTDTHIYHSPRYRNKASQRFSTELPHSKSNSGHQMYAPFFPQQLLNRTRGQSVTKQLIREQETW